MVDSSVSVKRLWWKSGFRQSFAIIRRHGCVPHWTPSGHIGGLLAVAMFALATPWARAQANVGPSASPSASAVVKSFRIVQEKDGPAVEILSTKPLVPSIRALDNPPRLVIDLPNAKLDAIPKRISVHADRISTLRGDQFQANPPVARIVLDLEAPLPYTWDAAGNRLVVHLGKNRGAPSQSQFQAPSVPSLSPSLQQPAVATIRTSEPLAVAQNSLASGATITAAADTAVLGLARGGEVHVCPGTTVSVTPSQTGHNVMLGMSTGAMEAHFTLDASSDSIMTPDFRILLPGPGEFHYAFSADHQGNTCVRALPGNTASVIVSELMGDRTYQVKATDQLVFRSGQLDRVDMAVPLECGCPPSRPPILRAVNNLPVASEAPPANPMPASGGPAPSVATAPGDNTAPSAAPAAEMATNHTTPELHVQVEAPFVFHAKGPPPPPIEEVRALPLESRPLSAPALSAPLPPPARGTQKPTGPETARANPAAPGGFFRKLGRFFAAIFR
jgi:AMIN domain